MKKISSKVPLFLYCPIKIFWPERGSQVSLCSGLTIKPKLLKCAHTSPSIQLNFPAGHKINDFIFPNFGLGANAAENKKPVGQLHTQLWPERVGSIKKQTSRKNCPNTIAGLQSNVQTVASGRQSNDK